MKYTPIYALRGYKGWKQLFGQKALNTERINTYYFHDPAFKRESEEILMRKILMNQTIDEIAFRAFKK